MIDFFKKAKERTIAYFSKAGDLLVIAPHQDDESLGCGGTIALAKKAGLKVSVIFVTDGSQSHPGSEKYAGAKLIALREQEALQALHILGVDNDAVFFMRLPDGSLPFKAETGFNESVKQMFVLLQTIKPGIVLLPWRRDPHRDHRATWEITTAAIAQIGIAPMVIEYFIWLWERAGADDMPHNDEGTVFYMNIALEMAIKKSAIMAHVSQTTDLINDDENGFTLSAAVLSHFDYPKEYFIQTSI